MSANDRWSRRPHSEKEYNVLTSLRESVCRANLDLVKCGLVTLTFGNVSGRDPERNLVAIKPSGVAYEELTPEDIVLLDLDGNIVEGNLRPSSDTPTHLALYRAFPEAGGVTHSHSTYATAFAQAMTSIPCLGTTHADVFYGEVPCTRPLTREEIGGYYEANTGAVIVERFTGLDPMRIPGVLVANHGPFTWGRDAAESVRNSVALEEIARSAIATLTLNPTIRPIPGHLLDKHFMRKHGPKAYYGQK